MTRNGNQRNGSRGRVGTWRCAKRPGYSNCGQMSITAQPLEHLVGEAVIVALEGPSLARVLAGASDGKDDDDTAVAELADVEARLMGLAEAFADGDISGLNGCGRAEARPASDGRPCLAPSPAAFGGLGLLRSPRAIRDAWPQLETAQRRAIIGAVVDRITVNAATRRGPVFDPERVDVCGRSDSARVEGRPGGTRAQLLRCAPPRASRLSVQSSAESRPSKICRPLEREPIIV